MPNKVLEIIARIHNLLAPSIERHIMSLHLAVFIKKMCDDTCMNPSAGIHVLENSTKRHHRKH